MYLVFLLYALFASVFTISKTALEYTQPFFFVGVRMAAAGVILLAYLYFFKREQFKLQGIHFFRIFCLALFNIYLANTFEFWGLQYLTSFKTCFIYSLSPFAAALFSFLIFSEKMSARKWLGLIIGFGGLMPMLLAHTSAEESAGQFFFFSWAELAVMGAAFSSVYGWILLKQLVKEDGYSPMMANGASMLLGGAMALVHSAFTENWSPVPVTEALPVINCTLMLIIISNLICYNLYGFLLKQFSATFMSFAGLSTPLFTALFGWLFLSETITPIFYISLLIVFAGLLIFYQEELKPASEPIQQITN
jgi:drug/metabolite transporter (DMT)-like permease